jgi:hypothetical protein
MNGNGLQTIARTFSTAGLVALLAAGCNSQHGQQAAGVTTTPGATTPVAKPTPSITPVTTSTPAYTPVFAAVDFSPLDRGAGTPTTTAYGAYEELFTDATAFYAFWTAHTPALTMPIIDFSKECVLGAFLGFMSGGSHTTEVIAVEGEAQGQGVRAVIREFRLAPWKPNTKQLTSPFHVVRCATTVAAGAPVLVRRQHLLDFEKIESGSLSAIGANDPTYQGELVLIDNKTDLADFYARHNPGGGIPIVDFADSLVVAVLGGFQGSFGHSVETRRVLFDEQTGEMRVLSRVNGYRGGAAPPPVTESPYQILRVARVAATSIRSEQATRLLTAGLALGQQCQYAGAAENLVIRDAATFAALWSARIGGPLPTVDFQHEQVVAVFSGQHSSGGFGISVSTVQQFEDGELDIRVSTMMPFGNSTTVMTSPFQMVTMPRTYGPCAFEVIDDTPRP